VKTVYIVRVKGKHEVCKLDHLYSDWLVSEPAKIVSRTLHTSGLMIFPFHERAVSHAPSYLWRTWLNARLVFAVTTIECESDGRKEGSRCIVYLADNTHTHTPGVNKVGTNKANQRVKSIQPFMQRKCLFCTWHGHI